MAGYDQHILDPWLNPKIVANFDEIEKYKTITDSYKINEPLEQFGYGEIGKIASGNVGGTMLAGAARTQGARNIRAAKESQGLGAAAMARTGNNPGSAAATTIYDRMLQKQVNDTNNQTTAQIVGNLPAYTNAAAGWADQGNRDRDRKMQGQNAYQAAFSNAVGMRQQNQQFTKQKTFWDKFKEGVGVVGNIVGIASGIGAPFGMMSGGQPVGAAGKPPVGGDGGYG